MHCMHTVVHQTIMPIYSVEQWLLCRHVVLDEFGCHATFLYIIITIIITIIIIIIVIIITYHYQSSHIIINHHISFWHIIRFVYHASHHYHLILEVPFWSNVWWNDRWPQCTLVSSMFEFCGKSCYLTVFPSYLWQWNVPSCKSSEDKNVWKRILHSDLNVYDWLWLYIYIYPPLYVWPFTYICICT